MDGITFTTTVEKICFRDMACACLRWKAKSKENELHINVGGSRFIVKTSILKKFNLSRLSRLYECRNSLRSVRQLCDDLEDEKEVYYFDRDPEAFPFIIKCYDTSIVGNEISCSINKYLAQIEPVHLPRSLCPIRFQEEKEYWGVEDAPLDICCQEKHDEAATFVKQVGEEISNKLAACEVRNQRSSMSFRTVYNREDFRNNLEKIRWYLWAMFTEPSSSIMGKIWAWLSVAAIVTSLFTFVVGTLQSFHMVDEDGVEVENEVMRLIDLICLAWFTLEYILRLLVSPKKLLFVSQPMNIIDLFTIVPSFVQIGMTQYSDGSEGNLKSFSHVVKVFRVMRVMRVLRLGRHSIGLQVLCKTVVKSWRELSLIGCYLACGILILAFAEYVLEEIAFGEALWWAIITVATVGYGDVYPKTIPGKIIASTAFLIGVLAIAVPVHPFIANFTSFYQRSSDIDYAFKRSMKRKDFFTNIPESCDDHSTRRKCMSVNSKRRSSVTKLRRSSNTVRSSEIATSAFMYRRDDKVPCNCSFCDGIEG